MLVEVSVDHHGVSGSSLLGDLCPPEELLKYWLSPIPVMWRCLEMGHQNLVTFWREGLHLFVLSLHSYCFRIPDEWFLFLTDFANQSFCCVCVMLLPNPVPFCPAYQTRCPIPISSRVSSFSSGLSHTRLVPTYVAPSLTLCEVLPVFPHGLRTF